MAQIILILGRRGTGKTSLARRLISGWPPSRVLVHDPMGEFPSYEVIDDAASADSIPAGSLVLADEIDLIAPPNAWRTSWIRNVIHYGRHLDVTLIGCSRRPANVHRDVTALASTVFLGRITEPRDLDYCASAWGECCYQAADLPPHKFLHLTP